MTDPLLERDPKLKAIVERLIAAFQPERIYLFGSKARGEEGPDSDYDLMVIVPESNEPPYWRAQAAQEVLWGIWEAADVLIMTREEFESRRDVSTSLAATVLSEGKTLYAA